ncbi:MAG: HAMP domain-containing sensor histidine kinase [Clostridiales bacterium]|nr:HAMP domain-containing sensor histidine kinase [Clostridiales bacterium]HBM80767.1 two-component sensor histidine kinase [Clostridiaceae bacterium]
MKIKLPSMKHSLYSKLLITYFGVMAISFMFLAAAFSAWFKSNYYNEKKQALLSQAPILNSFYEQYGNGNLKPDDLFADLRVMDALVDSRIWFVNYWYEVVGVSSSENQNLIGTSLLNDDVTKVLKDGETVVKEDVFSDIFKQHMLTVMFPLVINNQIVGAAVFNTSVQGIVSGLIKIYKFIWISAIFTICISIFVIYYFSQRILIKPLNEINKTARLISNGEFKKRVKNISKDEIGQLAETFNHMADALENLENLRRDFIANISHELRSPITSIRGFIQGILDGTIAEDKEKYYLKIALSESKRLTRLISDVLDLSRLESGEFSLKIGKFDINELIRITIIRFEKEIEEKDLSGNVVLYGDELYVLADRDRIGQVVSNLIDNAIKFTGNGGIITIKTSIEDRKVVVSIGDTGVGIPEKELKLIWDRFHMVDKSRSTKKGTGLGLSIVKQIIKQHDESIWVESEEGKGTTFYFTLTLA